MPIFLLYARGAIIQPVIWARALPWIVPKILPSAGELNFQILKREWQDSNLRQAGSNGS
jgi:hypothetical protein